MRESRRGGGAGAVSKAFVCVHPWFDCARYWRAPLGGDGGACETPVRRDADVWTRIYLSILILARRRRLALSRDGVEGGVVLGARTGVGGVISQLTSVFTDR